MPLTTNPPEGFVAIDPADLVPSPQSMVAEKSETAPFGLASVNVATAPLKATVAMVVIDIGLAVRGASTTFTSNGVCWLEPLASFQLIVA